MPIIKPISDLRNKAKEISALVHLMLQLKPEDRPASAVDVIKAIDVLLR